MQSNEAQCISLLDETGIGLVLKLAAGFISLLVDNQPTPPTSRVGQIRICDFCTGTYTPCIP